MRVLVCGGRDYRNSRLVQETLCLVECEGDIAEQSDAGMQSTNADRWMQLLAEAMGCEDFTKIPESRYQEARARLSERVEQAKKRAAAEGSAPHTETNQ